MCQNLREEFSNFLDNWANDTLESRNMFAIGSYEIVRHVENVFLEGELHRISFFIVDKIIDDLTEI